MTLTLKFNWVPEVVGVHVRAKFHQAECGGSWVIVSTNFSKLSVHEHVCDLGRWAGTKPPRPATNSSFSTTNSTGWCHLNHFFSQRCWSEVFEEMPAKELTEANCYSRHNCSKLLLMNVRLLIISKNIIQDLNHSRNKFYKANNTQNFNIIYNNNYFIY